MSVTILTNYVGCFWVNFDNKNTCINVRMWKRWWALYLYWLLALILVVSGFTKLMVWVACPWWSLCILTSSSTITINCSTQKALSLSLSLSLSLHPYTLICSLITWNQGLEKLTKLKLLSIQSNRLVKIEGLEALVNLEELYISHNGIKKMEGLGTLVNLVTLDVSNNFIKRVENVSHLTKLEEVWVNTWSLMKPSNW